MAGLFRREQGKSDDTLGSGVYPAFSYPYPTERIHENPALRIIREPEQNKETDALQEAN